MKKITVLLLCLLLLFGATLSVSAALPPLQPGRVNRDSDINIKDATEIQKYLADLCELTKKQEYCADVDNDGKVTVKDATMIQKYVAGLITEFDKQPLHIDIYTDALYADFDSGMAMAGVPVTFTANAKGFMEPFSYEFLINDVVVSECSQSNKFTYTFDDAGEYSVTVRVYNSFPAMNEFKTIYEVAEPYESDVPVIKAFYYDKHYFAGFPYQCMNCFDENITITAEAMFGSGDYEYCFLINDEVTQDFSENNQYLLKKPEDRKTYEITVLVRDSSTGDGFISKTITVESGYIA